jgi:SAM-dependent methyltransferase
MDDYSERRYLFSKTTVDDRALNKDVLACLRRELPPSEAAPLRVLEIGGGLGTMIARLVEWGVLRKAQYTLLDVDADLLAGAREFLAGWAAARGYALDPRPDSLGMQSGHVDVTVTFVQAELGEYLTRQPEPTVEVLIANAFLDLVDVPGVLPRLLGMLASGGIFWFPINYDGDTIFEPAHADDASFLAIYHRSMDQRVRYGRPAGDSKTGRHLFRHLAEAGATVVCAGSSDWVVHATQGRYDADEEYFLHHIVHTIDEELRKHPEVDLEALARWVELRHDQARQRQLVFIAHQLDFVGKRNDRPAP